MHLAQPSAEPGRSGWMSPQLQRTNSVCEELSGGGPAAAAAAAGHLSKDLKRSSGASPSPQGSPCPHRGTRLAQQSESQPQTGDPYIKVLIGLVTRSVPNNTAGTV